MPGLPQQLRKIPTPVPWAPANSPDWWAKAVHSTASQAYRQTTETINALMKVGTLADRTTDPGLNEILYYTTDEGVLYLGVDGAWVLVGGGGLGAFTVSADGVVITGTVTPPGVALRATLTATADGQFLQGALGEANDAGFDSVSMTGLTAQVHVEGDVTGSNWVSPLIVQNLGSQPAQSLIEANGPAWVGLDLTNIEPDTTVFGGLRIGIAMVADHAIALNATADTSPGGPTAAGTSYIIYTSSGAAIVTVVGANPTLQVYVDKVVTAGPMFVAGSLFVIAGGSASIADELSVGGNTFLGGDLNFNNSQMSTGGATALTAVSPTNKPGSTSGAGPSAWMPVFNNGVLGWVPWWID